MKHQGPSSKLQNSSNPQSPSALRAHAAGRTAVGAWGLVVAASTVLTAGEATTGPIVHDPSQQTVMISDARGDLVLRLRYDGRCRLDQARVGGRNVLAATGGIWTGLKAQGRWQTTLDGLPSPAVSVSSNVVTVQGLGFGAGEVRYRETWWFESREDQIRWRIEREYLSGGAVEDVGLAAWDFADMSTWTGALLGHGGVAWGRLFDQPNATYGVHAGAVLLWSRDASTGLRIVPAAASSAHVATRFTRQPDGRFTLAHAVTGERLTTAHGLRRFLRDRQDVWAPWRVEPGKVAVEFTIEAVALEEAMDRGRFPHFNEAAIRGILNTIARIGAIDDEVMGSNGYYSGYAVLHEPWIAQLGLALNDPAYTQAYARTLDHQRDHAIGPDGRVKSRWSYTAGDAMPGSYDAHGYYECQWGWLMDAQPSYVINVAEQFDLTGELDWVRRHQASARSALDYLLRRDTDGNGLVEMMTGSHQEAKGSDWIDVIWASHENAFVNAQLYHALRCWADVEEVLGDQARARQYREQAARLKQRFNAPTDAGGLWSEDKQCYAHWREPDGSIHGDNLVVPVNFMAIAYELSEPAGRARAILDQIEARMQREGLFFWPLCLDSYRPGEGAAWQFPFPKYENGDLFLAWGETGTRAYARHDPGVAVKYIRNVLAQYERDGLAFQRYRRTDQRGEGDDILANNASPVVGLYRNICGIQPKWNRLQLEPHLIPELNGTLLRYTLRGQRYDIALRVDDYRVAADGMAFRSRGPFGVAVAAERAEYFHGASARPSLRVIRSGAGPVEWSIEAWPSDPRGRRTWTVSGGTAGMADEQVLMQLAPDTEYRLRSGGSEAVLLRSDGEGRLRVPGVIPTGTLLRFELEP